MTERKQGQPRHFKGLLIDFTSFFFTKKGLRKIIKEKNAERLVNYFGWKYIPKENRISKQSKVNNYEN